MNGRHLYFRFLGHFGIRAETEWLGGPSPKKGREFIQYLGVYPRRVATRDELAEAFWPGVDPEEVAHRIHLAASGARVYLRLALAGCDAITCTPGGYAWDESMTVASDVAELLALSRNGSSESLEQAAAMYGGVFLAGETADWMRPMRIRCASAYECAVDDVARRAMMAGDHAKALSYGLQLMDAEPAHEGAVRLVMRCFAALGHRERVLLCYNALVTYLQDHLGLGPTGETTALALELTKEETGEFSESAARGQDVMILR